MEVHAHTPRKKWTHYFWEFLMLFLAVFCGFLAEYQLEYKNEHDREKVNMQNMLEDLNSDTLIYADYGIKKLGFTVENKKVKSLTVRVADFVEFTPYEFIKTK